ncbi:hypothetical protein LMH87_002788 [Akanthomyces muscarius]|uniref:Uncharacterized protein n=1 Tax=Akanthomyces muscarius TaxID=2231603 RepID=A0A9W8UHD3_AKAMU|nr:hypothetical protein LMH87_002788 [Akanthomyces muscarius]KAJ4148311.1 hypothetical protein LMH87_002788 [Akanthomyces muscarius]
MSQVELQLVMIPLDWWVEAALHRTGSRTLPPLTPALSSLALATRPEPAQLPPEFKHFSARFAEWIRRGNCWQVARTDFA